MQQLADPNEAVAQRVAKSRERQRRTKILRRVLPLVLIGVLLCGAAVRMRNRGHVAAATAQFEADTAELIRIFEETGALPLFYRPRDSDGLPRDSSGFTYVDAPLIRYLGKSDKDFIVAYSPAVRQILGPEARVVAVRQGDRIRVQVIRSPDFYDRMAEQKRRMEEALEAAGQEPPSLP